MSATKEEIRLFGIDLAKFSPKVQFAICAGGTFFFYIIYGYLVELIFSFEEFKPYGWYLSLIQFSCYVMFALAEQQMSGRTTRRIPMKTYLGIGLLTVISMGLSNQSLGYLNYPTNMIFKCCKLIPVFIGGLVIQRKKFILMDFLACLMMCIGLVFFTLADSTVQPSFNLFGVFLVCFALCGDAAIGNVQEKYMKQYGSNTTEMVVYSYSIGCLYILLVLILTGDLIPAFTLCAKHPVKTYVYAGILSFMGYMGVNFVLTMIKTFGALLAVTGKDSEGAYWNKNTEGFASLMAATVTTCRKAATIILSFLFFAKPFTIQYVWSGLIVLLGIILSIYNKERTKWNLYITEKWQKIKYGEIFQSKAEASAPV